MSSTYPKTRVKICGHRSSEEAQVSVLNGADAIGLIVGTRFFSEDEVTPAEAMAIFSSLPPFVSSVMVTHLQAADEIFDTYSKVLSSTIQLHNNVSIDTIKNLRRMLPAIKMIKAIHVIDSSSIGHALEFSTHVDAILLDSRCEGRIGGTGIIHDWSTSREIVDLCKTPVILAGGLNPHNVMQAISVVKPFCVDVNSGVDLPNGDKCPEKIANFIHKVRNGPSP
jgi:phosphoribosylanthranilate isomerase